jgi:hypothetical protein
LLLAENILPGTIELQLKTKLENIKFGKEKDVYGWNFILDA